MERKQKGELKIAKKVLGFLPGLLYNILVIFCVILIAIIVMQRISDSNRSVGGYKIFKVVSGSMVPKYDVGEVVICKETSMSDIKVGDAIVYRGKIGDLNGRIVMHEVVNIQRDKNNKLTFYAKGLNNSKGDPEINESQVLGVVKFKSGILTLLYRLATSIYSAFVIITILVINVFVSFKSGKKVEDDDEQDDKKNTEPDVGKKLQNDQNLQSERNILVEKTQLEDSIYSANEEKKSIENKQIQEKDLQNKIVKEPTKKQNTKKTNSETTQKEKIVIDSKQEFDKIENVESSTSKKKTTKTTSKSTTSSEKKATTPKKASTTKKSAKVETESENIAKTERSARSKNKKE